MYCTPTPPNPPFVLRPNNRCSQRILVSHLDLASQFGPSSRQRNPPVSAQLPEVFHELQGVRPPVSLLVIHANLLSGSPACGTAENIRHA